MITDPHPSSAARVRSVTRNVDPGHHQTWVMMGLGATARSVHRTVQRWFPHATILGVDDSAPARAQARSQGWIKTLAPEQVNAQSFDTPPLLIIAPGIPTTHRFVAQARQNDWPVINDLDLWGYLTQNPQPFGINPPQETIGVTGTNGKSSVVNLLTHALQRLSINAIAAGNVGLPVLDALLDHPQTPNLCWILELSSFQLEITTQPRIDAAVVTNIQVDHLDRHGTIEGYAAAKAHIARLLNPQAPLWVQTGASSLWPQTDPQPRWFTPSLDPAPWPDHWQSTDCLNAHWALHLIRHLHPTIAPSALHQALRSYPRLAHRGTIVAQTDRLVFIDNAKATNPSAAAMALMSVKTPGPILWLTGGLTKGATFDELHPALSRVHTAFAYGADRNTLSQFLHTKHVRHVVCRTLDDAIDRAIHVASDLKQPGTILLAPACSTLDAFAHYRAAGEHFSQRSQQHTQHPKSGPS